MVTQYTVTLVCIAAVGRVGELELAGAAMSMSIWAIMGQSIIVSMLGGLDTQASQVNEGTALTISSFEGMTDQMNA